MPVYDPNKVAQAPQGTFPKDAVGGTEWSRTEPLLTPQLLVQRFLFGIPLVSQVPNPLTKKPDVKTPDILKDHIMRAIATLEAELQVQIFPMQFEEPVPYDRVFMEQWMYIRLKNRPVLSVEKLAIRPQNNTRAEDILVFPNTWLSLTNAHKGQINLIPLVAATNESFSQISTGNGAAFLLAFIGQASWVPSYWVVTYTAGFPEGNIPRVLNELIGVQAAMDILSDIASTFRISSYSLGLDGMSQSQSTPGPQVYKVRMDELEKKKKTLLNRVRTIYGTKLNMGTI